MNKIRPTIRDVANLAGVSHQTVSRVINREGRVNPETRDKVEDAISKLGYIPNVIAKSMARGATKTLACISPNLIDYTYASIIDAAQAEVRQLGYYIISVSVPDEELFSKIIAELVLSGRTDGLLLINPCVHQWKKYLPQAFPVVIAGAYPFEDSVNTASLDEIAAGRMATQHLIENGHRKIAVIAGPADEYSAQARLTGYRDALRNASIPYHSTLIMEGDWSATAGYQAVEMLLSAGAEFTAIFAQNDRMAVGAIKSLQSHQMNVPEDVSVVGFDDIPLASYFTPSLTTMQQNMDELGKQAARLLIRALEQSEPEFEHIKIPSHIILRSSTASL
jgi:DNA-binding LacI/PurR family transcriptional regulator